jgi:hypothetical protein
LILFKRNKFLVAHRVPLLEAVLVAVKLVVALQAVGLLVVVLQEVVLQEVGLQEAVGLPEAELGAEALQLANQPW